ncbi:hypothetical protein [Corynebacterium stationis]|uniref:hypothetical protein n=1 Tax=Corynebacterium stationis TaxID=1705 RepID=UPI00099CBC70|nr:hypothetical protein [Corynebacterium stationis]AQX70242.1 hypothetical protein CA21670_00990 [Corynebacterium stationis]ASJ17939.1 hypothetical protein BA700_01855 [Corynebacterium stationis]
MTINEKSPAGAANTNEGNENLSKDSTPALYMLKRGANTGDSFGTWSGALLPKSDYMEVVVSISDLRAAYKNGKGDFTLNQECVIAHDSEIRRLQAEKEEQRRQMEERAALYREENALIKSITGMDLSREDLPLIMLEYRRAGKDFKRFLDALEAIDDLDLQRVGLTAWEWDLDELESEEGDFNDED